MSSQIFFCFDPADYGRVKAAVFSAFVQPENVFPENVYSDPESASALLSAADITVIFIGKQTYQNEKCLQSIEESFRAGKAFLSVYLNNREDIQKKGKHITGKNPTELFYFAHPDGQTELRQGETVFPGRLRRRSTAKEFKAKTDFIRVYDFVRDNGAVNLSRWIEEERRRKADFWEQCNKINPEEWPKALQVTYQGGIAGFFLYYDFVRSCLKKEEAG